MNSLTKITVETTVNADIATTWLVFTSPLHIVKWNHASDDWHSPSAENDLRVNGRFSYRMEAKDGSFGFDFSGTYDVVDTHKQIEFTIDDNRKVDIIFEDKGDKTRIIETFEAENSNSLELQQTGWQAILDNFKKYTESLLELEDLHFEITINAPVEKVYKKMIQEDSYKEWASEFNPSSHYVGSWEKGSKILFIGCDENGNEGGMVSRIAENIPNKYISINHLGLYTDGKEIISGPEIIGWSGVLENYTFIDNGNSTILQVELGSNPEFISYFETFWPKALNKLKFICENN